jgi:hypothetical protein
MPQSECNCAPDENGNIIHNSWAHPVRQPGVKGRSGPLPEADRVKARLERLERENFARIQACVDALTPMVTNETHAWNLWNLIASDRGPIREALEHVWNETISTERRIHYSYGINSGTHSGYGSYEELQQQMESATSGPVQVDKREFRRVGFGYWTTDDKDTR